MRHLGKDKPNILLTQSIVRAKFCESLAPLAGMKERSADLFLLGIFSLIDAFVDRPMSEIVAELPLVPDVKAALLGEQKNELWQVLQVAVAFENADWLLFERCVEKLNLKEERIPQLYLEAVEWSDNFGKQ